MFFARPVVCAEGSRIAFEHWAGGDLARVADGQLQIGNQIGHVFCGHRPSRHRRVERVPTGIDAFGNCTAEGVVGVAFVIAVGSLVFTLGVPTLRMLAEQGGRRERRCGLPELRPQPPAPSIRAMTGDASASRHSHMHAHAPGNYGPAGCTRRGEIDSLSVALKLGGPATAIADRIETEKKSRRDKHDQDNQDDAADLRSEQVSSSGGQCNVLLVGSFDVRKP